LRNGIGSTLFLSLILTVGIGLGACEQCQAETVCEVQDYDPATGFSWLNGQRVTVTGVVTIEPGIFVPAYTSIYIRGLDGDVCGINVFTFDPVPGGLQLGDTLTVTGDVEEYVLPGGDGATTEIVVAGTGITNIRRTDVNYVEPEVFATGSVGREENEGRLVRVSGKVTSKDGSREFTVNDNTGDILIFDFGRMFETDPTWRDLRIGDKVTVTGLLTQAGPGPPYLSGYRIWPRSPNPPYEDVVTPQCIPDTVTTQATLEITDLDGNAVSIFCPGCPGGTSVVVIRYNGPHTWRSDLKIYDTYGREIATLRDFTTLCGATEIEWTGRNELNERLPMGLYHVVATSTNPSSGEKTREIVPLVIGKRLR
jgi:hypothetical protein